MKPALRPVFNGKTSPVPRQHNIARTDIKFTLMWLWHRRLNCDREYMKKEFNKCARHLVNSTYALNQVGSILYEITARLVLSDP